MHIVAGRDARSLKRGKIDIKDVFCGTITESEEGYSFAYDMS